MENESTITSTTTSTPISNIHDEEMTTVTNQLQPSSYNLPDETPTSTSNIPDEEINVTENAIQITSMDIDTNNHTNKIISIDLNTDTNNSPASNTDNNENFIIIDNNIIHNIDDDDDDDDTPKLTIDENSQESENNENTIPTQIKIVSVRSLADDEKTNSKDSIKSTRNNNSKNYSMNDSINDSLNANIEMLDNLTKMPNNITSDIISKNLENPSTSSAFIDLIDLAEENQDENMNDIVLTKPPTSTNNRSTSNESNQTGRTNKRKSVPTQRSMNNDDIIFEETTIPKPIRKNSDNTDVLRLKVIRSIPNSNADLIKKVAFLRVCINYMLTELGRQPVQTFNPGTVSRLKSKYLRSSPK